MVSATVIRTNMINYWWLGRMNKSTLRGLGPNQKGCYRDIISGNKEVQCQVRESSLVELRLISSTMDRMGGAERAEAIARGWEKAEADDGRT